MERLRRVRMRIDDPHFVLSCMKYMSWIRFNYTFYLEEDQLQKFMALCLMNDIALDTNISDINCTVIRPGRLWEWKKK